MTFSEEPAARVASLYREHLEESFQGTLGFDPIRVEPTRDRFDRDALHVTVVYDGGHGLLHPAKLNGISSRMADVVLIPCKPRVWDVWACEDIVGAVKSRQENNRGRPRAAFVISMGRPRTRLGRRIDAALAELGLPILWGRTTEREAYAVVAGEGGSVLDGRVRVARDEINGICDELQEMCDDLRPKARDVR